MPPRLLRVTAIACVIGFLVAVSSAQEKEDGKLFDHGSGLEMLGAPDLYDNGRDAYGKLEYETAISLFRQVVAGLKGESDAEKQIELGARIFIAKSLGKLGLVAEAEFELYAGLKKAESAREPSARPMEAGYTLLLKILLHEGKWNGAEKACRNYLKALERWRGDPNQARHFLVVALRSQNKYAEAVTEIRMLIKERPKYFGSWDVDYWKLRRELAECLVRAGRPDLGLNEARDTLFGIQQLFSADNEEIPLTRIVISDAFMTLRRPSEAEGQLRPVLEARTRSLGKTHRETIRTAFKLGVCLWAQRKYETALSAADGAARDARENLGAEHPDTREYERFLTSLRIK